MAGKLVPLVVLPRFTTLVGEAQFLTVPVEVTRFQGAVVTAWRGKLRSPGGLNVEFEESDDQDTWWACDGPNPGASLPEEEEEILQVVLTKRWLRLKVDLVAVLNLQVTCWAVGHLEVRE